MGVQTHYLVAVFSKENVPCWTQEFSTIILLVCFHFMAYCNFINCLTLLIINWILTAASLFYSSYMAHLYLCLLSHMLPSLLQGSSALKHMPEVSLYTYLSFNLPFCLLLAKGHNHLIKKWWAITALYIKEKKPFCEIKGGWTY